MKKIGIITYHRANNYGAVLQCYALQETITKLNDYKVEVVDYRPEYIENEYKVFINPMKLKKTSLIVKTKVLIKNFFPYEIMRRYKKNKPFEEFRKKYLKVSSNTFNNVKQMSVLNKYDVCITGSDQIWNIDIHKIIDDIYFLNDKNSSYKKVAYAASLGKKDVRESNIQEFVERVNGYDYVSIREQNSANFVQEVTEKDINNTLDPVLLLEEESWNKIASNSIINQPYILVYDIEYKKEIAEIVDYLSDKLNISVIAYSSKKNYKNCVSDFRNVGPSEFVKLFKDAQFVVTTSFHGTAFSVIFEKNFITVPSTNRGNRMIDLLTKIQLSDRLVNNLHDLKSKNIVLNQDICYVESKKILQKEIEYSKQFLLRSIEE